MKTVGSALSVSTNEVKRKASLPSAFGIHQLLLFPPPQLHSLAVDEVVRFSSSITRLPLKIRKSLAFLSAERVSDLLLQKEKPPSENFTKRLCARINNFSISSSDFDYIIEEELFKHSLDIPDWSPICASVQTFQVKDIFPSLFLGAPSIYLM